MKFGFQYSGKRNILSYRPDLLPELNFENLLQFLRHLSYEIYVQYIMTESRNIYGEFIGMLIIRGRECLAHILI